MKHVLTLVACACTLYAAGTAHAALLTFNDPGVITIDNNTGVATYTEAGYKVVGPATSYLTLDSALVGGFDSTAFSLMSLDGGAFALQSFDFAFYDLGLAPGILSVVGLRNGAQVISTSVSLTQPGSVFFSTGSAWANVTQVSFSADSGFSLDNISAVPEPGTFALAASALLVMGTGMGILKRRRQA
jgi:hypothetical protein